MLLSLANLDPHSAETIKHAVSDHGLGSTTGVVGLRENMELNENSQSYACLTQAGG